MTYQDTEKDFATMTKAPYCMPIDVKFRFNSRSDCVFDLWAVGVVILEVLVGSEFILTIEDHQGILLLFEDCKPYMDNELVTLISVLLNDDDFRELFMVVRSV